MMTNKGIRDEAVRRVMHTLNYTKNPVNEYIADAVIKQSLIDDEAECRAKGAEKHA